MKHIIWDFNGTLLNDAQLSVDLDNYVFDRIGVPRITLEDYRNNMTMPVRDFYPLVGGITMRTAMRKSRASGWMSSIGKPSAWGCSPARWKPYKGCTHRAEASRCFPLPMSRR